MAIYFINPVESPFFSVVPNGNRDFGRIKGQSMRARRRRMAHPARFYPAGGHAWIRDALVPA